MYMYNTVKFMFEAKYALFLYLKTFVTELLED